MTLLGLVLGIAAALAGGELFVRGTVGLASWARVPAAVIGTTVAAFATSAPELSVAVNSATSGKSEIALGDALGSNVVNVALVLGIAIVMSPLVAGRDAARRDIPLAVAAPVLTGVLLVDGQLARLDGIVLLATFALWLGYSASHAWRRRSAVVEVLGERRRSRSLLETGLGLALLVLAGRLIVVAAKEIGEALDLDPFVVGATLVALGTSMPELATTVMSRLRGHDEIGLGTVVGSNLFNNLWIVGVAAVIDPIEVEGSEVAVGIVAGAGTAIAILPGRTGLLGRGRGIALLMTYAVYVTVLLAVRA